jgi:hypothetical protein
MTIHSLTPATALLRSLVFALRASSLRRPCGRGMSLCCSASPCPPWRISPPKKSSGGTVRHVFPPIPARGGVFPSEKWTSWGLNPRPSVCKTDALPLSYMPGAPPSCVVAGLWFAAENRHLFSGPFLFRCGIVVRTPGFHPGDPGSIPGSGIISTAKKLLVNVSDANGRILLGAVGSALGC